MARNLVAVALIVMAVVGLASADGPSAAPSYAPTQATSSASAPTKASPAATPKASTIAAAPSTSASSPSISEAPESSLSSGIASPPAPGSEAAMGPTGEFFSPNEAPVSDTPAESPKNAGAALKVSAVVGVAAVAGSLLF